MQSNNLIKVKSDTSRDVIQSAELFHHPTHVVWEYVENSISYTSEEISPEVSVKISKVKKSIVISDNARGMAITDLDRFFTVHGENWDRAQGRLVRGRNGTGGLSAFGIASKLCIRTVNNGKLNIVSLTREEINNNTGKQEFPVNHEVVEEKTNESNGTTIFIENIHSSIKLSSKSIIDHIENKIRVKPRDTKVTVDGHLCEYHEPPSILEKRFKPNDEESKIIGDVELIIKASGGDLLEYQQGIAVSAIGEIHETVNPIKGKDMSDRIFGYIDVPKLDQETSPPAIDQSRKGLNKQNKLVRHLFAFIHRCMEEIREELLKQKRDRKKNEELKKFENLDREISNIINEHFKEYSSELSKTNAKSTGGLDFFTGEKNTDQNQEQSNDSENLAYGGDIPASRIEEVTFGNSDTEIKTPANGKPLLKLDEENPSTQGSKISDGKRAAPRGGFSVKPENLGLAEKRAKYDKENRTIYINLDHPQLSAAYKKAGGEVDNEIFKWLYYEVAFMEYVIALVTHKAVDGFYLEPTEALFDVLEQVNKIAVKSANLYS